MIHVVLFIAFVALILLLNEYEKGIKRELERPPFWRRRGRDSDV